MTSGTAEKREGHGDETHATGRITKQRRDLWRREQIALDALEAIDPDKATDVDIIEVAAEYLLATWRPPYRLFIAHDVRPSAPRQLARIRKRWPNYQPHPPIGPCPLPYDWRRKELVGIRTNDEASARRWIAKAMRLSYAVGRCHGGIDNLVGSGPGSLTQIRARQRQRLRRPPLPTALARNGERCKMKNDYETIPGEREIWRGRQWSVTTFCIHRLNSSYWIALKRVQRESDPKQYSLLTHMAGKHIDFDDFITAYLVACTYTGTQVKNIGKLITQARKKWQRGKESKQRLDAEAHALGYADGELFCMKFGADGHFHPLPKADVTTTSE